MRGISLHLVRQASRLLAIWCMRRNNTKVKYSLTVVVALFAAGLLFAVSSEAKIDPETVAGMWLFYGNDEGVARDFSDNGNDGILTNDPEWDDDGKFDSALEFDGNAAYVNCGNGPSLDITEEITVVAWVNFNGVDYKNGTGGLFTIAAKGYPDALAPHAGWWFSHDNRDNGQSFSYTCFGNKGGGWAGGGNNFSGCNFQFTKGDWYHVAITVGDSIGKMYVDGTQIGTDKIFASLALSDTSSDLTIGSAGTRYHFDGMIDEFAIFSAELEEEDIQDVMDRGLEKASGIFAVDPSGKLTTTWANIKAR